MPRKESSFGRKPGYWEKLKQGTSHPTYNPDKEGYGNAWEWDAIFQVRMGFKEAQEHKAGRGGWGSDWAMLSKLSGCTVTETSTWQEVKHAFREAAKAHHPDTHPGDKQAEENFKDASAAFAMLENIYEVEGRKK
jgi:DnaJ domain